MRAGTANSPVWVKRRPTPLKAASAFADGLIGHAHPVATAIAASALRTLCRPGRFSSTCSGGSSVFIYVRCTLEAHARAVGLDLVAAHQGFRVQAVGGDGTRHEGHDLAHVGVIHAQHGAAVERQALRELDEGALQARHIVPVGVHVIRVDVGHDGHHRQQVQEGRVGFIGLDHDVVALPQARIGAGGIQAAADHEGRVQPAGGQHAGHRWWWWSCRAFRPRRCRASGASARPA